MQDRIYNAQKLNQGASFNYSGYAAMSTTGESGCWTGPLVPSATILQSHNLNTPTVEPSTSSKSDFLAKLLSRGLAERTVGI